MANDTTELAAVGGSCLQGGGAANDALGPSRAKSQDDDVEEALLRIGDRLFGPMMAAAQAGNAGDDKIPPLPDWESIVGAPRDLEAEREAFLKSRVARPSSAFGSPSSRPKRGLGPRVYVVIDTEYQAHRPGRNRVLSIQMLLMGPRGHLHYKALSLEDDDGVYGRPSLGSSIAELLEEAEDFGVIDDHPREVILGFYFGRADVTAFSDSRKFIRQLDGVGGTLATAKGAAKLELQLSDEREHQLRTRYQTVIGDAFDPKLLQVRVIDVSRLAPPGVGVDDLGRWLGLEKIELPAGYSKDKMAEFKRKEPALFAAYGRRDTEVTMAYLLWVIWFSNRHLGLKGLSATISSLSVRLVEQCIQRDGASVDVALGFENVDYMRWNPKTNRAVTRQQRAPTNVRRWLENFLADAYLGGRNECYYTGPTVAGVRFYDPDLAGAYLTGLAYLKVLDYRRFRTTERVEDFLGPVAGFAVVKFKFPAGTRFPCLPIKSEKMGLLYVLQGVSLVTAPEIALAHAMGAELKIEIGIVIPYTSREEVVANCPGDQARGWRPVRPAKPDAGVASPGGADDDGYRLYESFALMVRELRLKYRRKSLPFLLLKLLGNGAYGKIGQGHNGKKAFGPREMGSVPVGPSRISDAAMAALVCGLIRAVIGEILWKVPAETTVVSATTDGFLLDRAIPDLDLDGELCQRFKALVDRVAPGTDMLENKHRMLQVIAMRTRGQITAQRDGGYAFVTAKAGVKPGRNVDDENDFMLDLYLNRQPGQYVPRESFIPLRDQVLKGHDLQTTVAPVKLNLEPDFKRRLKNPRMVEVSGKNTAHLALSSEPWSTVQEAELARVIFDQWRETHCLKTEEDWADWQAFFAFQLSNRGRKRAASPGEGRVSRGGGGRVNLTGTGYAGIALRTFLTAFVKKEWGLDRDRMTQAALVTWLNERGYCVTLGSVKNAGRSLLNEQVVPATPEVMAFLAAVQERFPGLETERFFSPAMPEA